MKILSLKFKNINSLAGEWKIDFTEPQFADNGLFAITGKTGSGKSSILDAIALALYGKTPRVEITGNENAVMTRGEKDCYAEITFEVGSKIWKSKWLQEKTRTGNLKPVQRQISDHANKILADQVRSCDTKIIEIIGLTFEQFTKVVMLAQGSFAAFLQADKNDKGELLEQITGTEIYGEISKKVFERFKTEKEKLDKINIQIGEIKVLSEEETDQLRIENEELRMKKEVLDKELQIIETEKKWFEDLQNLQNQIVKSKENLPNLEEKANVAQQIFEEKAHAFKLAKDMWAKYEPIFKQVRELDTKIAEKNKLLQSYSQNEEVLKNAEKDLTEKMLICSEIQKTFEQQESTLTEKIKEFETKKEELSNILKGKELFDLQKIKVNIVNFGSQIKNLIDTENAIMYAEKEISVFDEKIKESQNLEKELSVKIATDKKNTIQLEKEINLLNENIQLTKTIQSFEEHRKVLKDGEKCPLCGSKEHPFALGNVPQTGTKEQELAAMKKQLQDITYTALQNEKMLAKLIADKENALINKQKEEKELRENEIKKSELTDIIKNLQPDFMYTNIDSLNKIRNEKLSEHGQITKIIAEAEVVEQQIKNLRDEEIPKLQQTKQATEQKRSVAQTTQKLAEQTVENHKKLFAEKQKEKDSIEKEKESLIMERKNIFAEKWVDDEEKHLKNLILQSENEKIAAEKEKNDNITEIEKIKAIVLEKEKEWSEKESQKITEKSIEELQINFDNNKKKSDELLQKIGANSQILNTNEHNLKHNGEKHTEKEKQQQICNRWGNLNELIGSSDGKKYRNFAQALTFEHLIGLANSQLQKMSERYLLKRIEDTANPFELVVIDKFHNCDERTAQNLSGGEKFIVSLSLALGLSNMASRNMRIDTMFIDEGFGTLDTDYLDIALSALSNLQNEGKLIGVISHLSELKERIATHIEITPKGNGYSWVEVKM